MKTKARLSLTHRCSLLAIHLSIIHSKYPQNDFAPFKMNELMQRTKSDMMHNYTLFVNEDKYAQSIVHVLPLFCLKEDLHCAGGPLYHSK